MQGIQAHGRLEMSKYYFEMYEKSLVYSSLKVTRLKKM